MDNETSLAKVAFSLPPGSMVYLKSEDLFYLKVEEKDNIWRIVDMVRVSCGAPLKQLFM